MLPTMQSAEALTREQKQQFEEENPGWYWTKNTLSIQEVFEAGDKPAIWGYVDDLDIDKVKITIFNPCGELVDFLFAKVPTYSQNQWDRFDLQIMSTTGSGWYYSGLYNVASETIDGIYLASAAGLFKGPGPDVFSPEDPLCDVEETVSSKEGTATITPKVIPKVIIPKYIPKDSSSDLIFSLSDLTKPVIKDGWDLNIASGKSWTFWTGSYTYSSKMNCFYLYGNIVGPASSWITPNPYDQGIFCANDTVPKIVWSVKVPPNQSPGDYKFDVIQKKCRAEDSTFCYTTIKQSSITVYQPFKPLKPLTSLTSSWKDDLILSPIIEQPQEEANVKPYVLKGAFYAERLNGVSCSTNYCPREIEFKDGMSVSTGSKLVKLEGETNMIEIGTGSSIEQTEEGTLKLWYGKIKSTTIIHKKCMIDKFGVVEYAEDGKIYCHPIKSMRILTPTAAVAIRGTEFIMSYSIPDKLTDIIVKEGSVEITNNYERTIILQAGQYATVNNSGEIFVEPASSEIYEQVEESFISKASAEPSSSPPSGGGSSEQVSDGWGKWFLVLGPAIIVAIIIWWDRKRKKNRTESSGEQKQVLHQRKVGKNSSLVILEKRYAKGDISKEEFDNIKKDVT